MVEHKLKQKLYCANSNNSLRYTDCLDDHHIVLDRIALEISIDVSVIHIESDKRVA